MTLYFKIKNKKSKIDGFGAFALEDIPARRKIGNLAGEIISKKEARKRAASIDRVAIVEFYDNRALDATTNSNQLKFINHSCKLKTFMRVCYDKVEFYTLKDIPKGDELTCNYGPTHHAGTKACRCGATGCIGFL